MNNVKGQLLLSIAIIAIVGCNALQAESYYEQAKAKLSHAYDKTADKAREYYDKATGKAVEGPRVQMENGKMKTSLITTEGAGQYTTKKTIPTERFDSAPYGTTVITEEFRSNPPVEEFRYGTTETFR